MTRHIDLAGQLLILWAVPCAFAWLSFSAADWLTSALLGV
jgi:hypothetical protein